MTFSDPVILQLIASISSTVLALIGLIAIVLNGRNSKQRAEVTQDKVEDAKQVTVVSGRATQQMVNMVDSKTDALRTTANEIHAATNSTLSNANAALAIANETIKGMRFLIENMEAAKVVADRVIHDRKASGNGQ